MARKKKFAPNDNNLAIAYYRFSSHSQNDASIDQQRELAHDWADAHGFKIVQEYEDAAISGTTDARPGFQQMLSEVAKIRPHTLIMWKTDRLGRDKYVLAMAKKKIRDAGCEIHLLAEHIPTEGPEGVLIEGLMEAMAEYYSRQLSQNIQRGMDYNAQHALYNGHKLFGYDVDRSTKKYIPDPSTAPFVQWAFKEYASGRPLKAIAEEMNAQGLRTPRNAKFSVNMLNKMLKNRAYIGEYHHGDITVAGGMPVLVDEATFDRAQRRFAENKRKGSQRAHGMDDADAPRYWLTGKLYCGECGSTMQGVSGTSKTGRTYYYYYCSAQRRKECHLHKARKRDLEDMVLFALHNIVDDEENMTALALDAAEYYERNHNDAAYLEALEAKRREVEKSLANLVKVIERGVVSDTVTQRLAQLEEQKSALNDAIGTENVRVSLCEDRHSIQAYLMLSMLPILLTKLTASIAIDLFEWKHLMVSKRNIENLIQEPEEAREGAPFAPERHDITFRDVSFSYMPGEPVLKRVSFTVPDGKLTAIVGDSGSGKSTILNLIAKFYEPQSGTIAIGGQSIQTVSAERVLAQLSMVDQQVFLFDDTVQENIRHARPTATDREVEAACRDAGCDGFVEKLEKSYDTGIGENGSLLSGGERQRLSIARAILKNSPILLLDEATASLDIENELAVKQAIANLLKERKTVVMIAHTLSIVKNADQILVVADGTIKESGTHEELLAENGKYAAMWNAEQKITV